MGRSPCCSKEDLQRGPWSAQEDTLLINYIRLHGEGHWRNLPKRAGLLRCGKSCRLRWMNYLRPDIKRGNITSDEDDLIIRLHSLLGNRWSLIAKRLPGRTDNEIKNYWNSHLSKRVERGRRTEPESKPSRQLKQRSLESADAEAAKNKIYLPKAVRVSSYCTTTRNIKEGNSIRPNDTQALSNTQPELLEQAIEQANNSEDAGAAHNEEHGYANGSDISFLDFVPIEDNMLDEILAEYQQLLNFQLDSF